MLQKEAPRKKKKKKRRRPCRPAQEKREDETKLAHKKRKDGKNIKSCKRAGDPCRCLLSVEWRGGGGIKAVGRRTYVRKNITRSHGAQPYHNTVTCNRHDKTSNIVRALSLCTVRFRRCSLGRHVDVTAEFRLESVAVTHALGGCA